MRLSCRLWRSGAPGAGYAAPRTARSPLRTRAFVGTPTSGAAAPPLLPAPRSSDLLHDSRLAGLSGLAYVPEHELEERLIRHGLELQTYGTTHFTRWFVARKTPAAAAAAPEPGSLSADPAQRFIFLRGVSWRSADLDALRVWQALMRALPTPFLPHLTSPSEQLVAHSGVAEMADELFAVLRPHMEGQTRVHLAGHSLGGSLATLVALTAQLKLGGCSVPSTSSSSSSGSTGSGSGSNGTGSSGAGSGGGGGGDGRQGRQCLQVQCTTFGSPPVLALAQGAAEDGRSILQALKLPLSSVRNYVLQDDPVPRALLSADPAFMALKQYPAVAGLLRLREQWLGQGVLSPTRFLFHPAGDVFLVRWSAETGHSVRLMEPHTLQEELSLDVDTLRSSPMALMQAVMDHHHGSYATELRAAAAALAKQEAAATSAAAAAAGAAAAAAEDEFSVPRA